MSVDDEFLDWIARTIDEWEKTIDADYILFKCFDKKEASDVASYLRDAGHLETYSYALETPGANTSDYAYAIRLTKRFGAGH